MMKTALHHHSTKTENTHAGPMAIASSLFFMWGFLTSLNDILVPSLKSIFDLNYMKVMMVQFSFFSSYFIFALPAGKLVESFGYKKTIICGLVTMMMGALLFLPASRLPSFAFFLSALIVLAAGITALQVAANPYVTNLGPPDTAASRLNLAQAFNSLGTFLAPIFGGYVILSHIGQLPTTLGLKGGALQAARIQQAASVQLPYLGIAITLGLLASALALVRLPSLKLTQELRLGTHNPVVEDSLWKHSELFLGALGIFLYVGAEVAIGSFLISFFELPNIGGLSATHASIYVSLYWGGSMVGRFIGSAILRRFTTSHVLGIAALCASSLVVIAMITDGHAAMIAIITVGLFNSIMFPSIFSLGIARLGPLTGRGSSVMVAAIIGGAIIPLLQGRLADSPVGLHHAFILPVFCYIYIAAFGFTRSSESQNG